MTTDSKEFLEVLEKVPKWHMLMPKAEKLRIGDSIIKNGERVILDFENSVDHAGYVNWAEEEARRSIPEPVRRSVAWWALYNQRAKVASDESMGWIYSVVDVRLGVVPNSASFGVKKFDSRDTAKAEIPVLGGESEIIKNLQEGPGAYMKWVLQ